MITDRIKKLEEDNKKLKKALRRLVDTVQANNYICFPTNPEITINKINDILR